MKFKVTGKSTRSVSVEFEEGSIATVPLSKGQTKEQIIKQASTFHNVVPFASVSDVPIEVSDTWLEHVEPDPEVDYRNARLSHYPRLEKQMDAAYWARQGDDTEQKAVDEAIKLVKEKIPKGTTYKASEVSGLLD